MVGDLAAVAQLRGGAAGARVAVLTAGGPLSHAWLRAARRIPLDLVLVVPPGGRTPDATTAQPPPPSPLLPAPSCHTSS